MSAPPEVVDVAAALHALDRTGFRERYERIDAVDYGLPLSAGEFHYLWRRLRDIKEFYQDAAEDGFHVLFLARTGRLAVADLEERMRPGASSEAGFLGPAESLRDVIARDVQVL